MKKYRVTIAEPRMFLVEANSEQEAFKNVYSGEELDMTCNDLIFIECEEEE